MTRLQLRDGDAINVRTLGPGDGEELASAFERLSPESRYRRFFTPMERLPSTSVRYLTEIDHADHEAIAAFGAQTGRLVGVARYVRTEPGSATAEVAVVVGDRWQGKGIASILLERLARRARAAGITHFLATILSDNAAAIELFTNLAPPGHTSRRFSDGNVEVMIELPEPGGLRHSRLGHLLRAAALGEVVVTPWRALRDAVDRRI